MFESLLALGELKLRMRETAPAFEVLTEALKTAESLSDEGKEALYSERCLALVYQRMGDYEAYLASTLSGPGRAAHAASANAWYDKALSIWSRWRSQNLAVPFSTNREKEILRVKATSGSLVSRL